MYKRQVQKNPETVKKIIRAIAKAVMYFRDDKQGSIAALQHHIGSINSDAEAGLIWDEVHNTFGAELPPDLFREIFESRRQTMIAARQWPQDKPLPDPEQFLARNLLDPTLKDMGYAVSYTHLDVYKRQALREAWRDPAMPGSLPT